MADKTIGGEGQSAKMWWNKTVETQTTDKCKLKKYRTLANGDCVEVKA